MSQNYILSEAAQQDLQSVLSYIAKDNLAAAKKVRDRVFELFSTIGENPFIGHFRQDLTDKNFRFVNIFSYLIIYDYTTQPVEIIRVLSASRDVGNII